MLRGIWRHLPPAVQPSRERHGEQVQHGRTDTSPVRQIEVVQVLGKLPCERRGQPACRPPCSTTIWPRPTTSGPVELGSESSWRMSRGVRLDRHHPGAVDQSTTASTTAPRPRRRPTVASVRRAQSVSPASGAPGAPNDRYVRWPALRWSRQTAHHCWPAARHRGGTAAGCEGLSAARVTDMHTCPMSDGPKPHVGGPITTGVASVLIGNLMAATVTSLCACASPAPDTVVRGSTTVLIGGMQAARVGDQTAHDGVITVGRHDRRLTRRSHTTSRRCRPRRRPGSAQARVQCLRSERMVSNALPIASSARG